MRTFNFRLGTERCQCGCVIKLHESLQWFSCGKCIYHQARNLNLAKPLIQSDSGSSKFIYLRTKTILLLIRTFNTNNKSSSFDWLSLLGYTFINESPWFAFINRCPTRSSLGPWSRIRRADWWVLHQLIWCFEDFCHIWCPESDWHGTLYLSGEIRFERWKPKWEGIPKRAEWGSTRWGKTVMKDLNEFADKKIRNKQPNWFSLEKKINK